MAVLSNGLETIEKGSTVWRIIINNNILKLYTKEECDNLFVKKSEQETPWATLGLSSGWVAESGYTAPAVKKNGNTVFIKGVASNTGDSGSVIAVLPSTYAPTEKRLFSSITEAGSSVSLSIDTSGNVTILAGDTSKVSLELSYEL